MSEFIAVKCCDCGVFQVAQVRKDKKFNCKMCAKKQSAIKVYTRSSRAAQCRKVVQELNMARGTAAEEYDALEQPMDSQESCGPVDKVEPEQSVWANYAREDQIEDIDIDDDDVIPTTMPDWNVRRTKRNRNANRRGEKRQRNNTNSDNNSHGAKRQSRGTNASRGENGYQYQQHLHGYHRQQSIPHDTPMHPAEFGSRLDPSSQNYPGNTNNTQSGGYFVDDGFLTTMGGDEAFEEEMYP